jgi:hypothetical protein
MVLGGTVTQPTRTLSKRSKQRIQPKLLMRAGLEHARDDAEVERTAAILVGCQVAEVGIKLPRLADSAYPQRSTEREHTACSLQKALSAEVDATAASLRNRGMQAVWLTAVLSHSRTFRGNLAANLRS